MKNKGIGIHHKLNFLGSLCLVVIVVMILTQCSSVVRSEETDKNATCNKSQEKIIEDRNQIQQEIKKIEAVLKEKEKGVPDAYYGSIERQLQLLQKIDLICQQQESQIKRSMDLQEDFEQLTDELSSLSMGEFSQKPPYSFLFFDDLKEQLVLLEAQYQTIQSTMNAAESSFQTAKDKLKKAERDLRHVKDELNSEEGTAIISPALIEGGLASRLAAEELCHEKINFENEKIERVIFELRMQILRRKITLVEPQVQFSHKALQTLVLQNEKDAVHFKNRLRKARIEEEMAHTRWENARKQMDNIVSRDELERKEKEVLTWKVWSDTYHYKGEIINRILENLEAVKENWPHRYALFHNLKSVDLPGLRKEVEQALKQLERENQLQNARNTDCRNEIFSLEKELKAAEDASGATWFIKEQIKAFKFREGLFKEVQDNNRSTQREYRKLLGEIEKKEQHVSIKQRLSSFWRVILKVWNYELTSVDDYSITMGKVILAFFLLILGFVFSRRLTARIGKQLIRRFGLDEAAAFAVQMIFHYLLLVLILLFVLQMVRIPLTFFTVVGGALAIGVGFGSQNMVNNFLSGLILMMERPIKIGDIVEVENVQGTVEWVGARSTRIRTFDNLRLVVPNSTLLQNSVINWSLTDDIVRREILVGVIYGSPTRKVEELIIRAAQEDKLIEKFPKPMVLFKDFGDNALIFGLLIWISMRRTGMSQQTILQVESSIRFRIDDLFRENDIVIAFPQQDVHLDTAKPLEIRVKHDGGDEKK